MKRYFIAMAALAFCAVAAVVLTFSPNLRFSLGEEDTRTLHVGVELSYPPFSYVDDSGQLTGFDIQVARTLCQAMHRSCVIETHVFSELLPSLKSNKLQVVVAGLGETPDRAQQFLFSNTYYRSRSFFIVADKSLRNITADMYPKLTFGVQSASVQEMIVRKRYQPYGAALRSYSTFDEMVQAINKHEINVIFCDGIPGYAILHSPQGRGLSFGGRPSDIDPRIWEAKIAVRKDDSELRDQINRALLQLQANGQYQELHSRFFPFVNL